MAVPVALLLLQACLARRDRLPTNWEPQALPDELGVIAVLIPAHNEGSGVRATIDSIATQLRPQDRILVVADNCSDDTAAVAVACGAECIERHHDTLRGKGFALDHGIQHLAKSAPSLVFMCDADCRVAPGSIARIAETTVRQNRPVQALDLMIARPDAGMSQRMAEFAWRFKNLVRPLGALGYRGPCQLMGTGMMFHWDTITAIPLASGALAEDMQMGVNLALKDKVPLFEPRALVTSHFPDTAAASQAQRKRWEHGHLATMTRAVPRLVWHGLRKGRLSILALGLDLTVPPLAFLLLLLLGLLAVDAILWLAGWTGLGALYFGVALVGTFFVSIAIAWSRFGRDIVSARELASAPWYALRKIPLYIAFFIKRQTAWVRAKRDGE